MPLLFEFNTDDGVLMEADSFLMTDRSSAMVLEYLTALINDLKEPIVLLCFCFVLKIELYGKVY